MKAQRSLTRPGAGLCGAVAGVFILASLALTSVVFGQANNAAGQAPAAAPGEIDQTLILAGLAVFQEAGCRNCHGWAANGEAEGPNPRGPSLRTTPLPMDLIRMTIACGRPGTEMPYFWSDAYRLSSTDCYGQTRTQLGNLLPPRGNARLSAQELDALSYYIENYVKGLGDITFEECIFFFGEGDQRCNAYPRRPG